MRVRIEHRVRPDVRTCIPTADPDLARCEDRTETPPRALARARRSSGGALSVPGLLSIAVGPPLPARGPAAHSPAFVSSAAGSADLLRRACGAGDERWGVPAAGRPPRGPAQFYMHAHEHKLKQRVTRVLQLQVPRADAGALLAKPKWRPLDRCDRPHVGRREPPIQGSERNRPRRLRGRTRQRQTQCRHAA